MLNVKRPSEISDEDRIVAVLEVMHYGTCNSLDFWDDGYGPLWRYRCSIATLGVVRATSWETAYDCATDEILDDAGVDCHCDIEDWDHDKHSEDCELYDVDGNLHEGYMYRSNGIPSNPRLHSAIASEDLNGSDLSPLPDKTEDDRAEYFIIVEEEEE